MAEAIGPVSFPVQMEKELDSRLCPACGQPITSVLADAVATAKPSGRESPFGAVEVDVSAEPLMFTFQPCGCRTTPDGKPVPDEVPTEPPVPLVQVIDAETREPLVTPGTAWPSPVKSRRGGHRGRARRK